MGLSVCHPAIHMCSETFVTFWIKEKHLEDIVYSWMLDTLMPLSNLFFFCQTTASLLHPEQESFVPYCQETYLIIANKYCTIGIYVYNKPRGKIHILRKKYTYYIFACYFSSHILNHLCDL